jgi:hypothetical protein
MSPKGPRGLLSMPKSKPKPWPSRSAGFAPAESDTGKRCRALYLAEELRRTTYLPIGHQNQTTSSLEQFRYVQWLLRVGIFCRDALLYSSATYGTLAARSNGGAIRRYGARAVAHVRSDDALQEPLLYSLDRDRRLDGNSSIGELSGHTNEDAHLCTVYPLETNNSSNLGVFASFGFLHVHDFVRLIRRRCFMVERPRRST